MEKQKRKPRSYKSTDSNYNKAMRRAKKEKLELATLVEVWVIAYGNKHDFLISSGDVLPIDISVSKQIKTK